MFSTFTSSRTICTSCRLLGKRNFRKFLLPKRGPNIFKERQKNEENKELQPYYYRWIREVGCTGKNGEYVTIPEKIPELIVPDLTDFELKPYVSYRVSDVVQEEFTPKDLFNAVYTKKIVEDFKNAKLDEHGNSLQPSEEEMLTPEEAKLKARQTGTDVFTELSVWEEQDRKFIRR